MIFFGVVCFLCSEYFANITESDDNKSPHNPKIRNRFGVCSILKIPTLKFTGSSDSHGEVLGKKKIIKKKGSTDKEVALLKDNFGSCIENKSYPSAQNLKEFIKKTAISRTVPVIEAKLQQLLKKSDMYH
ncbi:hypothetical protein JTB14_017818 [Gonioctena quinquepunctata]|nr:hypothetical protein JTB14_017818 [Gonioctena quinquepunctata]